MSVDRDEEGSRTLLRELVSDVRQWAEWNQVLGADSLPMEPPLSRVPASTDPTSPPPQKQPVGAPAPEHQQAQPQTIHQAPTPGDRPRFEPPTRAARPQTDRREGTTGVTPGELTHCERCGSPMGRDRQIFSVGSERAQLIVIGEGAERSDGLRGEPFMGRSGQLLTRMMRAIGLRRDEIYICNVFKSGSPSDGEASAERTCACTPPFVLQQFRPTNPRVVMAVGELAAQRLLGLNESMAHLRGKAHEWEGLPVVPSHHPDYLLRNPQAKREAWEDLLRVRELLSP